MIVRNEAGNLRPCLEPVARLFDEMVIVDTGSTDATPSLAAELGGRVVEFPWCDDFAAARNAGLPHIRGDWIFWLDADDRLDAENVRKLEQLLASLESPDRAYMMDCLSLSAQPADPVMVLPHCRLFPRHPDIRWQRRVHESVVDSLDKLGYPLVVTDLRIHHVGYQDAELVRRKAERNLRLLRLDHEQNPDDPLTLYHLGMAYLGVGDDAAALAQFHASLKQDPPEGAYWLRGLYHLLVETLLRANRLQEALTRLAEGLVRFPNDPTLATKQAELLANLGDLAAAERTLVALLQAPPPQAIIAGYQSTLDGREARYLLGQIYRAQGRPFDAEQVYQDLLRQQADSVQGWIGLAYAYLDQRRFGELEAVADQLAKFPCGEAYAANLRAESWMARGDAQQARDQLDRSVTKFPNLVWTRLLLADWQFKTNAAPAERLTACHDVLRLAPGNPWATAKLRELQG